MTTDTMSTTSTIDTIMHRLKSNARTNSDDIALVYKENNQWKQLSWKEYLDFVTTVARGFIALGHHKNQVVTILSNNRMEWLISDLAAMAIGGVVAGVYPTLTSEQAAYIIHHAESPICVVEDINQLNKIAKKKHDLPSLKWMVLLSGEVPEEMKNWVVSFKNLLIEAEGIPKELVEERLNNINTKDLATLIYTSGTTGDPKGVMLTHHNITWTADAILKILPNLKNQVAVSYLPLSHIAEQVLSIYASISIKVTLWIAESMEKLKENMIEARPTIFFGVPRVWEKFESALSAKFQQASGFKAFLLSFARHTATAYHIQREHNKIPSLLLEVKYAIAKKLVFSKLKTAIGLDRTNFFVSAAAPISRGTLEFFRSLDILIWEVYGQSEDTGPTTANTMHGYKLGTVGKPIPGVEVKLGADGEILVKGNNVFVGYYKNESATKESLIDGWLYSGDIGEFDSEGFLRITDRKKDLIITAGGKNIAPQSIEKKLKEIDVVSQAVVIGDRRKYLVALLTVTDELLRSWSEKNNIKWISLEDTIKSTEFRKYLAEKITLLNSQLANYETIKKYHILENDFTIETGELTPTMKIKRKVVNSKFSEIIESLYDKSE